MNKENMKPLKSKDPHKTAHGILKAFFLESLLEGSTGNIRWRKKILLTEWLWQFHHESDSDTLLPSGTRFFLQVQ